MVATRKDRYATRGFVIERGLFDGATVQRHIDEALRLCRDKGRELTDWNGRPVAGGERFADMTDSELLEQILAIHFPHKLSRLFARALAHAALVTVLQDIIGPNVKCAQSMLFVKQPGKPGQAWHQDEYFIPTRDRSLAGAWIALDAATADNGCLRVLPGSHRPGVLYPTRQHGNPEYDGAPEAYGYPDDPGDEIAVELAPGDVLFFNGYLLHSSRRNGAPAGTYRRSLVHHYLSAESLLPWNLGGLIEATDDNRDIVMVSGRDPYAWKGLHDNNRPFIRTGTW
ncbi:MAG: phytanoyl-CoA dioxygenase family protein [Pseudomonadota bacterium]